MQKKQRREKSSGALKDKCRKTAIFFLMTFFSIAYSSSKIKPTKAKQGTNYRKKTSLLYLYLYTKNFISLSKIPKTNPSLKNTSKKKETKKLFSFHTHAAAKHFRVSIKLTIKNQRLIFTIRPIQQRNAPLHTTGTVCFITLIQIQFIHAPSPQKTLRHFPQNDKANSKKQQGIFLRMTKRIKTQQYIQYSPPYLFNKETP